MGKSVYELITDRIIDQLQNGVIPWEKPWSGIRSGAFNRVTKKPYSLLNQMLLSKSGEYATYKQWQELGGQVRKGAKSEIVTFWKVTYIDVKQEDNTTRRETIPLLRYYNVFHISQVDGVTPLTDDSLHDVQPIEHAEKVLTDYWTRENITVKHAAGDDAYYSPRLDFIKLPLFEQFVNAEEYYSTAYHESIHSTMAESRCNRAEERKLQNVAFGSKMYSKEELIAEIGSASIMNILGIETKKSFRNSAAYIQSWLKVLSNDTRMIVSASSKAEKAVNYIMGEA